MLKKLRNVQILFKTEAFGVREPAGGSKFAEIHMEIRFFATAFNTARFGRRPIIGAQPATFMNCTVWPLIVFAWQQNAIS